MYKKAFEIIQKSKKIYIVAHIRPDGDAIGSVFSMYLALKNMGKDVLVVMPDHMRKYNFLNEIHETVKEVSEETYDLLICMDTSQKERLAISETDFNKAKKTMVFDHHMMNSIKSDLKIIDENSPANCEIIYDFFIKNKIKITKDIATYIYLGIMTDTGSFNYRRTTAKSYAVASELISLGAEFVEICKKINDTYSEKKLKLLGYIINHMESYFDGKVMFSKLTKEYMALIEADDEDTDSLVNYLRMIDGTEIAILAYPISDDIYKISMRTDGKIDSSKIARDFGGGGHIRASGFDTKDIEVAKDKLLKTIGEELKIESNGNS